MRLSTATTSSARMLSLKPPAPRCTFSAALIVAGNYGFTEDG